MGVSLGMELDVTSKVALATGVGVAEDNDSGTTAEGDTGIVGDRVTAAKVVVGLSGVA